MIGLELDLKTKSYRKGALDNMHQLRARIFIMHLPGAPGFRIPPEITCGTILFPRFRVGIFRAESGYPGSPSLKNTLKLGENNGGSRCNEDGQRKRS
jgi:hypothetical protein